MTLLFPDILGPTNTFLVLRSRSTLRRLRKFFTRSDLIMGMNPYARINDLCRYRLATIIMSVARIKHPVGVYEGAHIASHRHLAPLELRRLSALPAMRWRR